jgi:hypothetical protein
MTALIDLKAPKERFTRSINVERDAGSSAIDGYLPVGRSVDAISRIFRAVNDPNSENAFSITGPYGSGKSSLALMLDALFAAEDDPSRLSAHGLVASVIPEVAEMITLARKNLGAHQHGFVRAVVTAQREPVAATVLRALLHGVDRFGAPKKNKPRRAAAIKAIRAMHADYTADEPIRPDARSIRNEIAALGETAPVLLLIDEFGKNLEAFADSHSDADLYLLQELAEATRGEQQLPLVLVTFQHLAFDEYSAGANINQRREWAKIQGRFEDIPFVDSASQTRRLIAAAFDKPKKGLATSVTKWADQQKTVLTKLGVSNLAQEPDLLAQCWPLHPIALAILPELCERYGQNERTLFSFLASSEPGSVATYLRDTNWKSGDHLPAIRLEQVYDYFLESAANLVGVSNAASRWVEIDTRIRDAHGFADPKRRVLKAVGLLNLVSAGGTVRASKAILKEVCADGLKGTETPGQVTKRLAELEHDGLVTYRDYADEYRVWSGSDFDLKSAIDSARRRLREGDQAALLERILPMEPLVAARHFHKTGTLRAFARKWISENPENIEPLGIGDREDGTAFYVLGAEPPHSKVQRRANPKPVAFVTNPNPEPLIEAAVEVAALDEVLDDTESLGDDWVAAKELAERRVEARLEVERQAELLYGATSTSRGSWTYLRRTEKRRTFRPVEETAASRVMSEIADNWYGGAPVIRNDVFNRHELSAPAAKARRMLVEAMISAADQPSLRIEGSGPDKTLYRTTLKAFGLHSYERRAWKFTEPDNHTFTKTWEAIRQQLNEATTNRIQIDQIYAQLTAPPLGIRAGVAPVFLIAAILVHTDEIALYEHGTFKPRLTNDLIERLLRNPQNFALKHFASRTGSRAKVLAALAKRLEVKPTQSDRGRAPASVLGVVSHLVAAVTAVPPHIQRTAHLSDRAGAVRKQLLEATEPDELIFKAIPKALDLKSVPARGAYHDSRKLILRLGKVFDEINAAYPALLGNLRSELSEALGVRVSSERLQQHLADRAVQLEGQVIDPNLKKLVSALKTGLEGDDQWIEHVAMNLAGGTPPKHWTDDDRDRYRVELSDLAGTFLRVESLNADLLTKSDGFDAFRVAVTKAGGDERVILIPVDHQKRPALEQILSIALQQAADQGLNDTAARDALIALLADTAPREGATTPLVPKTVSVPEVDSADPGEVTASD